MRHKKRNPRHGRVPSVVSASPLTGVCTRMLVRIKIQVDVVPVVGGDGTQMACAVNYFREGASFLEAPVSPVGPLA